MSEVTASPEQPDLAAMIAAAVESAVAKMTTPSDDQKTVKASQTTAAKASAVKRNLDPTDVKVGDDESGPVFRVYSSTPGVGLLKAARVMPLAANAKGTLKSLTREHVEEIVANAPAILAAFDAVEKRAHIGRHAVKVES